MNLKKIKKYVLFLKEEIKKENIEENISYIWFINIMFYVFLEKNNYISYFIEKENIESSKNMNLILVIKLINEKNNYLFYKIDQKMENTFPYNFYEKNKCFIFDFLNNTEWNDPSILGWIHQYYFNHLKYTNLKNITTYTNEEISTLTQFFTPNWIIKYFIENTLIKKALDFDLYYKNKDKWKHIINSNKTEFENFNIERISINDPACGTGHILLLLFDTLYDLYEIKGYSKNEILYKIINNIYGFDIDYKAIKICEFTLSIKFIEKNKDLMLNNNFKLNIYSPYSINNNSLYHKKLLQYGSLYIIDIIKNNNIEKQDDIYIYFTKKYDIVITNPPYLGAKFYPKDLSNYIKTNYSESKADLFSVFIELNNIYLKKNGYIAMITPQSWLFIKKFFKIRKFVLDNYSIKSLLHMGRGIFGIDWGSAAFILKKENLKKEIDFFRLHDKNFQYLDINDIENIFINTINNKEYRFNFKSYNSRNASSNDNVKIYYRKNQKSFYKLQEYQLAYWIKENLFKSILKSKNLSHYAETRQGLATGNNSYFLRYWYEVNFDEIGFDFNSIKSFHQSNYNYVPYNKGGNYRKWYGNNIFVLKFNKHNYEKLRLSGNNLPSKQYYFREGITYSYVSSKGFNARFSPKGFVFDIIGSSVFPENTYKYYILCFLCSKITPELLKILNPTMASQVGNLANLPLLLPNEKTLNRINQLCVENIKICKDDWDNSELSYQFVNHFLLNNNKESLEKSFNYLIDYKIKQYNKLKDNEEIINKYFIYKYKMEEDLNPEVDNYLFTLSYPDEMKEIKSFLSYFVHYYFKILNKNNNSFLIYSNNNFFHENIYYHFKSFMKESFNNIDSDIKFLSETLNKHKNKIEKTINNYYIKNYFKDHYKLFFKSPLYWKFSSGKNDVFVFYLYYHKIQKNSFEKILLNYLNPLLKDYEKKINNNSADKKYLTELLLYKNKLINFLDNFHYIDYNLTIKENIKYYYDVLDSYYLKN